MVVVFSPFLNLDGSRVVFQGKLPQEFCVPKWSLNVGGIRPELTSLKGLVKEVWA